MFDPGLKKRVVSTTGRAGDANYHVECAPDPKWLIVIQSEKEPGISSPGPATRSFPINDGPVTMGWTENGYGWTVNQKVDHVTYPHPGGPGHFTFFSFGQHLDYGGGPFPIPGQFVTQYVIDYHQWMPAYGACTRLVVGAQFCNSYKSYLIELNLRSEGWGDQDPNSPVVIHSEDWYGDGTMEFLLLDAPGLFLGPSVEIAWGSMLSLLHGSPSVVQAVYIAIEVQGQAIADLWHAGFRATS